MSSPGPRESSSHTHYQRILRFAAVFLVIWGTWWFLFGFMGYSRVFFPTDYPSFGYIDLYPTFLAGKLFQAGEYDSIYNSRIFIQSHRDMHLKWLEYFLAHDLRNPGTSFVYAPLYLCLFGPLTSFFTSFTAYRSFWYIVNILAATVICLETLRLAGRNSWKMLLACAFCTSIFFPIPYAASLGQNILPAVALALLAFRFHEWNDSQGRMLACLCLILVVACKSWAVLLVLVFVYLRDWGTVAGTFGGIFLLLVWMPDWLFPPALSLGFREVSGQLVRLSLVSGNNVSLRGFLHRLNFPGWGTDLENYPRVEPPGGVFIAEGIVLLLVLAGVLFLLYSRRPDARTAFVCGLGLSILPSGICWHHYLSCFFPAAVFSLLVPNRGVLVKIVSGAFLVFESLSGLPGCYFGFLEPASVARAPTLWAVVFILPLLSGFLMVVSLLASRDSGSSGGVPPRIPENESSRPA